MLKAANENTYRVVSATSSTSGTINLFLSLDKLFWQDRPEETINVIIFLYICSLVKIHLWL